MLQAHTMSSEMLWLVLEFEDEDELASDFFIFLALVHDEVGNVIFA